MVDYNRSGPGHPPVSRETDHPVATALREAIAIMDQAYIAAVFQPSLKPYHRLCQEYVIMLARLI